MAPSIPISSCCTLQAGRHSDAVHAYRAALDSSGGGYRPSSRVYLQLARSYSSLRHPDWALQVFIQVGWVQGC